MKKFTKVVASRRVRVGRCHGGKIFKRHSRARWYLLLDCGHVAIRASVKVPRKVWCDRCEWDLKKCGRIHRDWFKKDLPGWL